MDFIIGERGVIKLHSRVNNGYEDRISEEMEDV